MTNETSDPACSELKGRRYELSRVGSNKEDYVALAEGAQLSHPYRRRHRPQA